MLVTEHVQFLNNIATTAHIQLKNNSIIFYTEVTGEYIYIYIYIIICASKEIKGFTFD